MPQGLKLWVNTFVLGAEDHSLMQELMVYRSIDVVFQIVSEIGACASFYKAAAQETVSQPIWFLNWNPL